MIRIAIAVVVGIAGFIGINLINSEDATPTEPSAFSVVQADVHSEAKLYDVRTSQEYAAGYFENAENWSLQDMQAGKYPDIPKTTKLYVYCQSGNRSSQATRLLNDAGFTNVVDLGGLQDVQSSGGTLQTL